MNPSRRLFLALFGLLAITVGGTLGYILVEGMSAIDALYMTVITMSTVGFNEVTPLSPPGRIFTIGLIVAGVGSALYLLATVSEILIEGQLRERITRTAMQRKIDQMSDHIIVCGFGRFGRVVVEELGLSGNQAVIIESDPGKEDELAQTGLPFLLGSATSDEVLERAGVDRASVLVVATATESDNVFITLSARERNNGLRIHARGESEAACRRLSLAGATQVTSTYQTGGQRMAASILRPSVVDFIEIARPSTGEEVDLEEIRLEPGCDLVGETVKAIEQRAPRVRIVAIKSGPDGIQLVPDEDTCIGSGDHLVVIGARSSLLVLAQLANASSAASV
jgi:voltage-gated potassium channel